MQSCQENLGCVKKIKFYKVELDCTFVEVS